MKLVAYDKKKLKVDGYTPTANMRFIEEFANSSMDCAKVEGWTQKKAWYCATSLNNTIKRMGKKNIKAISRKNEVFLLKTTE